jgi:hypothetical protein
VGGAGRLQQIIGCSRTGVEPPEAALPRHVPRQLEHVVGRRAIVGADVDLTVVGCDEQRRVVDQLGANLFDDVISGTELGFVVRTEAAFVGDLVDAVVVRVDQRLAGSQQLPDRDGQARRCSPADQSCSP